MFAADQPSSSQPNEIQPVRVIPLKKRKKKRHARKRPDMPRLNGFDFGVDQFFIVLSDFEFANLLHDANPGGCIYGSSRCDVVGGIVPLISLGARNVTPLKRAFEILSSWDRKPGDDGFSLEFVLLQSGGYLITISPEFEALRGRVAKADRFYSPLGMNVFWIFELSRQGPWIPDFRKYLAKPISPFLFAACEFVSEHRPPVHLPDIPEILKFEARFSDESDGTLTPFGRAILEKRAERRESQKSKAFPPRPEQTPPAILERRAEQLRRHFPVTLHRLEIGGQFEAFRSRNPRVNVMKSQYQQAYCNVLLSCEMVGSPHYQNISSRELVAAIGGRLGARVELANMTRLATVADTVLTKQVSLDAAYLLQQRGHRGLPDALDKLTEKLVAERLV
jgi:hypothetical protein